MTERRWPRVMAALALTPVAAAAFAVFGRDAVAAWSCMLFGHEWADGTRYGHRAECLNCGKERA